MRKLRNDELERLSPEGIKEATKHPVVIVLDNIRSMHNVGSAFRTADAFLCEKIVLCGITAQPPHREIHRSALGATDTVAWQYFENTTEALNALKSDGYLIASVEQADASTSLEQFHLNENEKIALVFGNEVKGVDDQVVAASDVVIEIPQFGTKHSLNISVAIGIVLWELISKWKFTSR
ncbi:MAG: RNA methyltransferase [Cyclobacteriaceae bacterium]|nr:RNA methyltransferase [Cyclobacteriaceae bacterium]